MDYDTTFLVQDLWEKYGFCANPFDMKPLSGTNRLLPLSEAIVGRGFDARESQILTNILRNPGGARVLIDGDIGVGKTTFLNYHRYLWENHAKDKLFTTAREISVTEDWRLQHFLINILCSLIEKLVLIKSEMDIRKNNIFREVLALSKVLLSKGFHLEGSIFGCGGGFGKSEQINVPMIPEVQLLQYFYAMVDEIKKCGFAGVFLHIDNLELFSYQNVQKAKMFFEEIRDAIQVPDVYFVFVSKKNFFQEVISPSERVRSVFFGRSITVPPLSKEQVINAIHKRYKLLAISKKKYILPVEDAFIEYLYRLYAGKLRYIMDAMNMILPEFASAPSTTITFKDAEMCLSYLLEEHIKNNLTAQEWKILFFCTTQEYFHNGIVSSQFQMPKSNVARVIKRFLELDFVYLEKKEGRTFYYKTHEYTRLISRVNRANKKSQKNKIITKHQISYPKRLLLALEIIEKQGSIRHKEYSHLLDVSLSTATRDLQKLLIDNKISAIGQGKQRYYKIAKKTK